MSAPVASESPRDGRHRKAPSGGVAFTCLWLGAQAATAGLLAATVWHAEVDVAPPAFAVPDSPPEAGAPAS